MDDDALIDALKVLHAAEELRRTLPRNSRDRQMIEADIEALTRDVRHLLADAGDVRLPDAREHLPVEDQAKVRTDGEHQPTEVAISQGVMQLRQWLDGRSDRSQPHHERDGAPPPLRAGRGNSG
ncbi:MAG TPA: hypothetical protein VNF73_14620 [Candidatus Saccharimonadales bacterium]|nr:hypothetical protein [Candidatus Saccharimonadales bacterium]